MLRKRWEVWVSYVREGEVLEEKALEHGLCWTKRGALRMANFYRTSPELLGVILDQMIESGGRPTILPEFSVRQVDA